MLRSRRLLSWFVLVALVLSAGGLLPARSADASGTPTLDSLSPSSAEAGAGDLTLHLFGSGFHTGTEVYFDHDLVPSTFDTATHMTATIPASKLATARSADVAVYNGGGEGGASNFKTFTITGQVVSPKTSRVSLTSGNAQANAHVGSPHISADGRYVVFTTASPLASDDTDDETDVYLHDRSTFTTTRVSLTSTGEPPEALVSNASVSSDGRYVAFTGTYEDKPFVPGTNDASQIYVRDRQTNTTVRASRAPNGAAGDRFSRDARIAAGGRYVVYVSESSNLVPGAGTGDDQVYVYDVQQGSNTVVSVASSGVLADKVTFQPAISADGRYVVFASAAANLVAGDTNYRTGGDVDDGTLYVTGSDVFLHDRTTGHTRRVSVASSGTEGAVTLIDGQPQGWASYPSVSDDGRYVAFQATYTNLAPGLPTSVASDGAIFLHDVATGATTLVSRSSAGDANNGPVSRPVVSGDGKYVVFAARATNLGADDTEHVYVYSRESGTLERASASTAGTAGSGPSYLASISADGRFVAFQSFATNLVADDTNGSIDAFVRDRTGGVTSWAQPADAGPALAPVQAPDCGANADCLVESIDCWLFGAAWTAARAGLATGGLSLDTFRGLRDRYLANSEEGQRLTQLYYEHGTEVVTMLATDPALLAEAGTVLKSVEPEVEALLGGNGENVTLSAEKVAQAKSLLQKIEAKAGPELKVVLQTEQALRPLDRMANKPVAQVAEEVVAKPRIRTYVPIGPRNANPL